MDWGSCSVICISVLPSRLKYIGTNIQDFPGQQKGWAEEKCTYGEPQLCNGPRALDAQWSLTDWGSWYNLGFPLSDWAARLSALGIMLLGTRCRSCSFLWRVPGHVQRIIKRIWGSCQMPHTVWQVYSMEAIKYHREYLGKLQGWMGCLLLGNWRQC